MSEFKYACPVCGQHIRCDSSQTGAVMDCPTCFQKIIVPQAPANADPKFIITGTQYVEKKTSAPVTAGGVVAPEKNFPMAVVVLLVLALAAGATVFAFRGKIFNVGGSAAPVNGLASTSSAQPGATKPPPKPPPVAPPANDTNWMLELGAAAIPETTAAGRIHGQNFIIERANFQNGTLTLRAGTRGPVEFGVTLNFEGATPEALAGKSFNVATNVDRAARVTLRWKEGDAAQKQSVDNGYALRLEFGAQANNHLPGKIYLCTPDAEKSYLMGTFSANIIKPKPKAPPKQ